MSQRKEIMTVNAKILADGRLWNYGPNALMQAEIRPIGSGPDHSPRAIITDYRTEVHTLCKRMQWNPCNPKRYQDFEEAVCSPARVVIEQVGESDFEIKLFETNVCNPDKTLISVDLEFSLVRGEGFRLKSDSLWQFESHTLIRQYPNEYMPPTIVTAYFIFLFLTDGDNPVHYEKFEFANGRENIKDVFRIAKDLERLRCPQSAL
ncbi:MAG: hypothetical protein U1C57_00920 [Candidatus Doudnabacteria bacterium]|nr:hypothetical protein [Candidatus Doudnabacteria bacterium]